MGLYERLLEEKEDLKKSGKIASEAPRYGQSRPCGGRTTIPEDLRNRVRNMTRSERLAFYETEEGRAHRERQDRVAYEMLERRGPSNRFEAMALAALRMKFNGFSEKPLKLD